jgi:trans-aconitate methyltransferase
MIDQQYIDFWEHKVSKDWKHISDKTNDQKKTHSQQLFVKHCIDQLNWSCVHSALDWGCGGGWLSVLLPKRVNLTLLDISIESLHEAKQIAPDANTVLFCPNDNQTILYHDLIFCYSVIQHLPSYDDWLHIVQNWLNIRPRYIAIRTKTMTKHEVKNISRYQRKQTFYRSNKKSKSYYDETNFLNSLVLSKQGVVNPFSKHYNLCYHMNDARTHSYENHGFFILERK